MRYGGGRAPGPTPDPRPTDPRGAAVKAYWLEGEIGAATIERPGLGLTPYSVEQADLIRGHGAA